MNKILISVLILVLLGSAAAATNLLDRVKELTGRKEKQSSAGALDEKTVAAGLKEALTVGTQNAVKSVSRTDGYFKNPAIRIPLPEKVKRVERPLRKIGLGKQVDEFIVTMNRAAEKAAPAATNIFIGAVKEMTIQDAYHILRGSDTAATDYMRSKTHAKLYTAFKPTVSKAVMDVGVTRSYQQLVGKAKKSRLITDESLDLDHHVTSKALDGLFTMVGEEEKKIRKDPVARVTDLLKKVFGK